MCTSYLPSFAGMSDLFSNVHARARSRYGSDHTPKTSLLFQPWSGDGILPSRSTPHIFIVTATCETSH